jgi:hypothetical protein
MVSPIFFQTKKTEPSFVKISTPSFDVFPISTTSIIPAFVSASTQTYSQTPVFKQAQVQKQTTKLFEETITRQPTISYFPMSSIIRPISSYIPPSIGGRRRGGSWGWFGVGKKYKFRKVTPSKYKYISPFKGRI